MANEKYTAWDGTEFNNANECILYNHAELEKRKNIETLKSAYYSNKEVLNNKELLAEKYGLTEEGLDTIDETFEQGYNNALELVFKTLNIDY